MSFRAREFRADKETQRCVCSTLPFPFHRNRRLITTTTPIQHPSWCTKQANAHQRTRPPRSYLTCSLPVTISYLPYHRFYSLLPCLLPSKNEKMRSGETRQAKSVGQTPPTNSGHNNRHIIKQKNLTKPVCQSLPLVSFASNIGYRSTNKQVNPTWRTWYRPLAEQTKIIYRPASYLILIARKKDIKLSNPRNKPTSKHKSLPKDPAQSSPAQPSP